MMNDTMSYPETVSIEEAKKRAREVHPDRLSYDRLTAKEIVRTAFGGEIPETDADGLIHYEIYHNKDRFTDKRIAGVKIHTRRAPTGFNKFYRGTKNRNGEDELDAETIRDKWNEVRERAEKVHERKMERKRREEARKRSEEETLREISDLREKLDMNSRYSSYFRHNGYTGDLKVNGDSLSFNVKGLTPDQARQMVDLLESFDNDN